MISYNLTSDMMVYASYSRGNSPGGLNVGASAAAAAVTFDEQTVDALELGLKTNWFDRRLQVNMALFDYNYTDLQIAQVREVPVPGGAPGQTVITSVFSNVAESDARGIELVLEAALTENWNIRATYTYLDSEINKYDKPASIPGGPEPLDLTGADVVQSPEQTALLAATYTTELGGGQLSLTGEVQYTSEYVSDYVGATAGTPYPGRPGVPPGVTTEQVIWQIPIEGRTVANLRGNYSFDNWVVSAYIRNLFNKEYLATGAAATTTTLANMVPGEPRTYELSIRRNF